MPARRSGALQVIFSFFLGLMVTAFIGVGVYTFHSGPQREFDRQTQDLDRQEQAIRNSRPPNELTAADRAEIQKLNDERNGLADASRAALEVWGRSTSIILVAFATLSMAISLVRADRLPVISNGLLLGGVFTMLYGVGWIIATDASITRFVVMSVSLATTLALGYVRFVRRSISAVSSEPKVAAGEGLAHIERQVRALEARMNEAASVLGRSSDH